eukprot:GFUD01032094.1.p1 GENE.GFUD01032094.1~~GFUD01032094.1.p1  ORF type:complete len:833 (-),score=203.32 GFUD01032094.1:77-2407(-)
MDPISKTESTPTDDRKLVFLYRSDKKVGVSDPLDHTQYAGVPIKYKAHTSTEEYSTECVQPAQIVQHNSTSHYSTEQHQQYQLYPTYTHPSIHSQEIFLEEPYPTTTTIHQQLPHTTSPQCIHPPQQQFQYNHPPHVHPQYYPHSPHVQYVPYYYYYPVPSHNTQLSPTTPEDHSSVTTVTQSSLAETIYNGSTTSCDSCIEDKVLRRKKKKKNANDNDKETKYEDDDSGYLNGAESSSELSSENELISVEYKNVTGKDSNRDAENCNINQENEKEITDLLIEQVQNPTIDFQFGEVQEILDELSRKKYLKKDQTVNVCDKTKLSNDLSSYMETSDLDSEMFESSSTGVDGLNEDTCTTDETFEKDTKVAGKHSCNISSKEKNNQTVSSSVIIGEKEGNQTLDSEFHKSGSPLEENKNRNCRIKAKKKKKQRKKKREPSVELTVSVSTPINNTALELDVKLETHEVEQCEVFDWTKVSKSRKSKYNKLKNSSAILTEFIQFKDIPIISEKELNENQENSEKIIGKASIKKSDRIVNENDQEPLEEIKSLFFQEKDVEILDILSLNSSKGSPSKTQKNLKKQKTKPKAKKLPIPYKDDEQCVNDLNSLMSELITPNLPLMFLQPFTNYDDYSPQVQENGINKLSSSPYNLTFIDPIFSPHMISDYSHHITCGKTGLPIEQENREEDSFMYFSMEEQLANMNVLKRSFTQGNVRRGLVMIRRQNIYGKMAPHNRNPPAKRTEVPGPRLKYSPVLRSGPLGVKRQVVPPLCLARRFTGT